MLIRLLPDQIMTYWELIKQAVDVGIAPIVKTDEQKMLTIQENFLINSLQCWVSMNKDRKINGVVATQVIFDITTGSRSLLILSVYSFDTSSGEDWIEGMETLKKYASSRSCDAIVLYTKLPKIIKIVEKLGGRVESTFMKVDL